MNHQRIRRLCLKEIEEISLNLDGAVILTEAACGAYVVTPVLAALAGASKVYAVAVDSVYASADEVCRLTNDLADLCGVREKIELVVGGKDEVVGQADIVTNLGFVRPIDKKCVALMKRGAVIPYMCEAWEFRPGDVDLAACRESKVPVMGTDEVRCGVFAYLGLLVAKMLFALDYEILGLKVAVVSNDSFGPHVEDSLGKMGAVVKCFNSVVVEGFRDFIKQADALIIADYRRESHLFGESSDFTGAQLAEIAPGLGVVQLTGGGDFDSLKRYGFKVYPDKLVPFYRMGSTLSDLGVAPVVKLHAAGLKVGQAMLEANRKGLAGKSFVKYVLYHAPAQELVDV